VPKHIGVIRGLFSKKEEKPDLYGDIDPAVNGNYAISLASANGHIKVVKLLLAKKEERPDLYGEITLEQQRCDSRLACPLKAGFIKWSVRNILKEAAP
jgi:ankyrin repeat protein